MSADELRKRDVEIHRMVMGLDVEFGPDPQDWPEVLLRSPHELRRGIAVPHYTTDIAAALQVLEEMRRRGWLFHVLTMCNGFVVNGREYVLPADGNWDNAMPGHGFVQEVGETATEAICNAALAATPDAAVAKSA